MTDRMARQLELELAANDYSHERLLRVIKKRVESGNSDELLEGRMILLHSIDRLAEKLTEYFNAPLRGKPASVRTLLAEEFSNAPKDLAYVILVTMVRYISKENMVPVSHMARTLNKNIHDSILVRRLENKDKKVASYIDNRYQYRSVEFRRREKLKIAYRQDGMRDSNLTPLTAYLGGVLIDIVEKSGINIIELRTVRQGEKTTKHIVYTDECYRMVLQSRDILLEDYRKYPIFLVKPKDWTTYKGSGGYYSDSIYKLSMIKARNETRGILQNYFNKNDTENLATILNTLQATPWRINQRVFEVMNHVFSSNIEDPEYPRHNPRLVGGLPLNAFMEPEDYINPHNYGELHKDGPHKGLPITRKMIRQRYKDIEDQRDICIANNGKALMQNMILSNAMEYLNEDEIYFSYQYDSRGRIYPIQQHLQPQGSGNIKSLLEFATGSKITTEEQHRWFIIHGANTYGFDKLPYDDRISKMLVLEKDILAAAEDPMANRTFWGGSDDPYMFLAWCFEYADYKQDPAGFESRLPIALDATCSGIQLYSGLLRDAEGARSVNVIGDTREDIYQKVADRVNKYLEEGDYQKVFYYVDKEGGEIIIDTTPIADSFKGKVSRSLVKRNVMTQPYSVTKRGMFDQLKFELTEIENNNKRFWVGDMWVVCKLLSDLNDRAIKEIVKGAKAGQEYLKEVTQDLVKRGEHIAYKTPLTNFPVVQRIGKRILQEIRTPIGRIAIRTPTDTLDKLRMGNGIAPNFIHSLDAALLATTVLKLADRGCTNFHMIHDSYGVPIGHVEDLNTLVRETFVELFEKDPLNIFVNTVNPTYEQSPEEVMLNTLDLKEVLDSKYIFS
jgi:DNA-directed RNA polymerase